MYSAEFDYFMTSGSNIRIATKATVGPDNADILVVSPTLVSNSATRIRLNFIATGGYFIIQAANATFTGWIDNISVRELPGNHAFQTTSANRPVLSARVNQFVNTETLATQTVTTRATTQTLRFTGSGSITLSGTATGTYTAGTYTITTTAGTLTATVSGSVTQADLRESNAGVGLPVYQRVGNVGVTPSDYDTAGFPLYLYANGTNTAMQTNSIDFTGTDKVTVWAGVRKLSDANRGMVVELGANPGTSTFQMNAPLSTVTGTYSFGSSGTSLATIEQSGFYAPVNGVLTGVGNISGAVSTLKVNGNADLSKTTSQGTGTYGNYPLYLFARAGTSLFFSGNFYGLIVRGTASSAAEIANAETWMNSKTKAY